MATIKRGQEEANMAIKEAVMIEEHLLGISNSIKRLKDLYHASNAVRMLITIIKISAFCVLLTFLTWLI
jgi:hypothetical protein